MKTPQNKPQPRQPQKKTAPAQTAQARQLEEIRALRAEVADLTARLSSIHERSAIGSGGGAASAETQAWIKIAATVGVTFALGKIMQMLKLPAAAAVAVPMITAEVNRRFF